jgi:hypothetical protein
MILRRGWELKPEGRCLFELNGEHVQMPESLVRCATQNQKVRCGG